MLCLRIHFTSKMWVTLFAVVIGSSYGVKISSIDTAYNKGVAAFSDERWSECIAQFEDAIYLYKLYKSVVVNCRLECHASQFDSVIKENLEDLRIYEKFFFIKNCLNDCHNKVFSKVNLNGDPDDSILDNMNLKTPYEYLHVCYYQMHALPKAASAAYTYLMAHPDSEIMKNNVQYYIEQPEVDKNELVDLESEDYAVLYKLGLKTYQESKWGETISALEEVILDYLSWENRCRAECERQPQQEWSPEFVITVSNNLASLLNCRQQCQDKLQELNYDTGMEFLADVLNYLQISYYHLGRMDDAAKAVASYLTLNPHDEEMLENKNIYLSLINKEAFTERSDIINYLKRDKYEKDILNIFHQRDSHINSNQII